VKPILKIKLALTLLMLAFVVGIAQSASTQNKDDVAAQEKRGRLIYLKGEAATEITALLGTDALEIPATSFACTNCHGLRGEGTSEGGLQPPPIDWQTLTQKHTSALTRRERPPYNATTLARAIIKGLSSDGTPMHPGMPRYVMTSEQVADLIAYLKKLGKESNADPGLTEGAIKVGAALPLSGPFAQIGEDIKATLSASFAQTNSQGGIYGRRIELVVQDSKGEPAQTTEATRRLIEQDGVFALVGSYEPADSDAVNVYIKSREVPLVGPITLTPRNEIPPNQFIFYLLPTFADQVRTLVDFINEKNGSKPSRAAAVFANNSFNLDALAGLKTQTKLYSIPMVIEQTYVVGHLDAPTIVKALVAAKPDYLFFFGGADEAKTLADEMERAGLKIPMLSSVVMLGRGAFTLPASIAAQTFLSYPSSLPNQDDFAEFLATMKTSGTALRAPAFQSIAFAATKVFLEAVKLSGKQLDRTALVSSLEQMQDFKTGVAPPITFTPNRRVGSRASYIVGIDLTKMQYQPLTDRRTPKEKP
jgi:ABC-type branched-subunit amino acid transport system substrate-binding protein